MLAGLVNLVCSIGLSWSVADFAAHRCSSDPMIRMEQMLIDSENLRHCDEEWRQPWWPREQPSYLTPYRIHGGVGPASSSI
jgi:hypothetical protein